MVTPELDVGCGPVQESAPEPALAVQLVAFVVVQASWMVPPA